jgi:fatty-acyl-CoA synthase
MGFLHNGELYLCGRQKDLVIIRGRNHDPSFIEQGLEGVDGLRVGCSAAFSVRDERGDTEELVVVAELDKETELSHEEIRKQAIESIQSATSIRVCDLVLVAPGTLPRTSSGKIRRSQTRHRYMTRELSAPERTNLKLVVREQARGYFHHTVRRLGMSARPHA